MERKGRSGNTQRAEAEEGEQTFSRLNGNSDVFRTGKKALIFEGLSEISNQPPSNCTDGENETPKGEETFPRSHCESDPRSATPPPPRI